MGISMIAAVSENGVIGKDQGMPWSLLGDLAYFRIKTLGSIVIMGRKTYESIGGTLSGRFNIIVSRTMDLNSIRASEGVVVRSVEEAFDFITTARETYGDTQPVGRINDIFIIGGEEIYKKGIELADTLYITRVLDVIEGDAYFPDIGKEWKLVSESEVYKADSRNTNDYQFAVYRKE